MLKSHNVTHIKKKKKIFIVYILSSEVELKFWRSGNPKCPAHTFPRRPVFFLLLEGGRLPFWPIITLGNCPTKKSLFCKVSATTIIEGRNYKQNVQYVWSFMNKIYSVSHSNIVHLVGKGILWHAHFILFHDRCFLLYIKWKVHSLLCPNWRCFC